MLHIEQQAWKLLIFFIATLTSIHGQNDGSFATGQLTAADVDDNLNFAWFLRFQAKMNTQDNPLPNPYLDNRIPIQVTDASGEPFSCAEVEIQGATYRTGTNGKVSLFPSLDAISFAEGETSSVSITAKPPGGGSCPEECVSTSIEENDVLEDINNTAVANADMIRNVVQLQIASLASSLPSQLDIALLIDTTGSMCDEIEYLKTELGAILLETSSTVDVRLAYIAFKSQGDSYDVRVSPFGETPNFADELGQEECTGGGNGELVHTALERASQLEWRPGNVARLVLIVGDEPPHNNLAQDMRDAVTAGVALRNLGVRVYGLAASGAEASAEYLFRLISMITGARYLWLTDDSGIGFPHGEPDVLCYQVTHLDKLLSRVIRSELTGKRVEADETHLIREVGQQDAGVCLYDLNDDELPDDGDNPDTAQFVPVPFDPGVDVSGAPTIAWYWPLFVAVAVAYAVSI